MSTVTPTNTVDAITLGESLGLVMGEPAAPLRAGSTVRFSFAGAESNVAIGLARLGHPVSFVTRVGDDSIGRMITETLLEKESTSPGSLSTPPLTPRS